MPNRSFVHLSVVFVLLFVAACGNDVASGTREGHARNVILFVADAAGVATLHGASLHGYGAPLSLHIQRWPHLGLSETMPVDSWVSDSANGMTSIVTGVKTRNGIVSQGPDAVRGTKDGEPLKTILEYAEERGLRTGVISSQSIADATPAACYARANDRDEWASIFPQAFEPRFGDGVDVLIGAGREEIGAQLAAAGSSFESLANRHGRTIYASLQEVPTAEKRPVVVADAIDVHAATLKALDILQASPTGYFLMVEWDAHTDDVRAGLQNLVDFDRLIAEVQKRVDLQDTLLLFTADHSFGFQVHGGAPDEPLLAGYEEWAASSTEHEPVRLEHVTINREHTAEEVVTLATGAGAKRVRGYFPSTYLFRVALQIESSD